jgi:hypothetical protein
MELILWGNVVQSGELPSAIVRFFPDYHIGIKLCSATWHYTNGIIERLQPGGGASFDTAKGLITVRLSPNPGKGYALTVSNDGPALPEGLIRVPAMDWG